MQIHAGAPADEAIGDLRRNAAREQRLFARLPPPRDDVVTFGHLVQQHRDVGRVILPVGVDGDHRRAARLLEARRESGRLSEVAAQLHCRHVWIGDGQLRQHRPAVVAAAVVHADDLIRTTQPLQHGRQFGVQSRQRLGFIIDGNHDREVERGCVHPTCRQLLTKSTRRAVGSARAIISCLTQRGDHRERVTKVSGQCTPSLLYNRTTFVKTPDCRPCRIG